MRMKLGTYEVGVSCSLSMSNDQSEEPPSSTALQLENLPPVLAHHPFVLKAHQIPESELRELNQFLQDMAVIVNERDNLKSELSRSRNGGNG